MVEKIKVHVKMQRCRPMVDSSHCRLLIADRWLRKKHSQAPASLSRIVYIRKNPNTPTIYMYLSGFAVSPGPASSTIPSHISHLISSTSHIRQTSCPTHLVVHLSHRCSYSHTLDITPPRHRTITRPYHSSRRRHRLLDFTLDCRLRSAVVPNTV